MNAASPKPVLEMRGIAKSFPGVKALEGVDLTLYPGQVTALIGENGAGKSTLVKILTGVYQPDGGTIVLDGTPVLFPTAEAAMDAGVSAIHQETVLFDELSVVENIFVGHQLTNRFGLLDWPAMRARTRAIMANIDPDIDPDTRLKDLGIARKHLVAIARALSVEATKIVIMDEPTAALSYKEVEDLYEIVERLKGQGKAILFISHKFEEIFRIADRYTVFRDGKPVGDGLVAEADTNKLISMMVGRTVEHIFPKIEVAPGGTVLEVQGLSHPTEFADISFSLRKGEILGFYGLVGAGRSEVMQALFGVTHPSAGTIRIEGKTIQPRTPIQAIDAGIVYVPEERGRQGAVTALPIFQNITLPSLARISRHGFLDLAKEFEITRHYAARLDLRASNLSQDVGTLSGGNQQKVVIGKWLATEPKVIILDEPTKGIDVGSKSAVHGFMSELASQGLSVIMVSSELPEILGMADRIVVMREGRIAGTFDRSAVDAEELVRHATGNTAKEAA
ncbi:sugar ABC transporter ATP-binding protein [Kaistia dalseonensis]|uniref:Rhamnose transport system ATP-binding protein n=1 Tax=Kaistia dalseonensis TaxID=410840 RepID=A0ABU0H668_9HYPH|nr:sugar ABC transporter ATP-binding protein [Kaistia dalseonensis]MCX5495227.1 sugar ABC transporter ATP-binding protein [Kaistia dalseonensis]MDQ0437813.1 rhamnose transport system ATP-binding protein [Kaistia dalseonensis]